MAKKIKPKKRKPKFVPKFVLYDLVDQEAYLFENIAAATKEAERYLTKEDFEPDEYIIAELKTIRRIKRQVTIIDTP